MKVTNNNNIDPNENILTIFLVLIACVVTFIMIFT